MRNDKTLGDYLERKYFNPIKEEPKLTFEEWFIKHTNNIPFEDWDCNLGESDMKACWKAAQENK